MKRERDEISYNVENKINSKLDKDRYKKVKEKRVLYIF